MSEKRDKLLELLQEFRTMVDEDIVTSEDLDARDAADVVLKYLREEYLGDGKYASAEEMFGTTTRMRWDSTKEK